MSKIVLLTANCLCNNPRAVKEATALARAGHDVRVLGAWFDPDLKARDERILKDAPFRYEAVLDGTLAGPGIAAAHTIRRARSKAANVLHGLTGWESPQQLGAATGNLFARAQSRAADLFIAHSEQALYVACRLMRTGRRVGVDMEDWFSEDLLPEARKRRPLRLLRRLERELLLAGAFASCPSRAMSEALSVEYGGKRPAVIYNAFPLAERQSIDDLRQDRRTGAGLSIYWYSQTLGPGRGLDDLVAALPLLDREIELHLRGKPAAGIEGWLMARIPERLRSRVFFHPQVPNDQLLSRIAEHDIGFAGEMKSCPSRDLTVTNKILHYLLGGLAVIASDTTGQKEIAAQAPGAVAIYESGNASSLAATIAKFVGSPEILARAKAASLQAAERTFCWEMQESVLLDAVAGALS